ncbi:Ig-like domain-containing protein [Fluviicola taffensis]|nr:Ig-like domain-containing protein [Fluviicola taffensis]
MNKIYFLLFSICPFLSFGQTKEITFSELTVGSGMYFGAVMTTTDITVTVQGPSDRFLAFGFGTGMATGNDAIIWSTLGSGAAPLQLRDHRMIGQGNEPTVDSQQDWTVVSNTISGGNRTIVATRALNTGDANDVAFTFASTTQNLFWAKGASASNQLVYHGAGNRASGIVRNWIVPDVTPPTISNTIPADNAIGASITTNLTINFSENISWGTGSLTLYDGNDNVIQTVSSGNPNVTITGTNFSYNPPSNLILNTSYYIKIDATAFKDAANNFFAGIADNVTWSFNTNDLVAPLVVAPFSPADDAVNVPSNGVCSISFNENVQISSTGVIEIFTSAGTLLESFNSGSAQLSVTGSTVNFSTTNPLGENTAYYIHITPGFIQDLAGNNFAGITTNTFWNFAVGDFSTPTIAGLNPLDNSIGVLLTTNPAITFNEPVALSTGSFFLVNELAGTSEEFSNSNGNTVISGNTVTLNPALDLESTTNYHILIDNNALMDLAGNPFAGISDTTDWSFRSTSELGLQELSMNEYSWNGKELIIQLDYSAGQIIDASGKLVRKIDSQKTVLDNLPIGIYTVRIHQNNVPSFFRIYME